MGQVVVKRLHLAPLVYEAKTAKQVDVHLDEVVKMREQAVTVPTSKSAETVGYADEAIDKLLELRTEITRGEHAAAGSRLDGVHDA